MHFRSKTIRFLVNILILTVFYGSTARASNLWEIQSIDTMKYSRDLAREKLNDKAFEEVVDAQVKEIALTGATHVAIGTPYDEEFIPFLVRWVNAARKHNLKVWYRGNFSGWEGWFSYPKISRAEHYTLTSDFLKAHKAIFQNGDIFSPCPECENGGPGDPRVNGDIAGHREFLINEYKLTKSFFKTLGKGVLSNILSMNMDVALLVMDKETTAAMGGVVSVDHYVPSSEKLTKDILALAEKSGGRIVLGELGAPIPDLHGDLNEKEQAAWINNALVGLSRSPNVLGINYWVGRGGSTKIWKNDGTPTQAVEVLTSFFSPKIVVGSVVDELGNSISGVLVTGNTKVAASDFTGNFKLSVVEETTFKFEHPDYKVLIATVSDASQDLHITLIQKNETLWFRIQKFFKKLIKDF